MLQAVVQSAPDFDLSNLDLITSRNNLQKIFHLISAAKSNDQSTLKELKFYVELIKPANKELTRYPVAEVSGTVLLYPANLQDNGMDENIDDDHGTEFLIHHNIISKSGSPLNSKEAKAIVYDFGGMKCMVQYPVQSMPSIPRGKQPVEREGVIDHAKRCLVKKKAKIRSAEEVDKWMENIQHKPSVEAVHNDSIFEAEKSTAPVSAQEEDTKDVQITGDEEQVSQDVEAWRLEQLDRLEDLQTTLERVSMHSFVPDVHSTAQGSHDVENHSSRERADSISSTSSAHSHASTRSMVSSRSSVSSAPSDIYAGHHHHHKKLHTLPPIAPTPPAEDVTKQVLNFDTPSSIWYNSHLSSSLFETEASDPYSLEACEEGSDEHHASLGTYRSTAKYQRVMEAWEKEHVETVKTMVSVLRKIRKAVGKSGRCKIVIESSGKVRPFKVKKTPQEEKGEVGIGRSTVQPKELLNRWG
ncbi:hypothetical protein BDZ91DRAFT_737587 [Kalaharituber pfeilii]|nr:hypothetical protein BDZ91DRAFT_737587 [Kalaharituber pfeilii]